MFVAELYLSGGKKLLGIEPSFDSCCAGGVKRDK